MDFTLRKFVHIEYVIKIFKTFYNLSNKHLKIESYWIYELCHGVHVRQYHETKQGGKVSET